MCGQVLGWTLEVKGIHGVLGRMAGVPSLNGDDPLVVFVVPVRAGLFGDCQTLPG